MKEWQIAQIMFGKNTKKECALVKKLLKNNSIVPLCDGWSIIYNNIEDDCGWLIPNECLPIN